MDPRRSAEYIAGRSQEVKICESGVTEAAKLIVESVRSGKFQMTDWLAQELHPQSQNQSAVDWCFFVDTINFSFWTPKESKFIVTYHGKPWTGYFAACACVNRALDQGIPLTDPKYYANISVDDLESIFVDDRGLVMPLIEERKTVLRDAGKVLLEKFNGSFYTCLERAEKSAKNLLAIIVDNFQSYRDTAVYDGTTVSMYKRAQILVADVWRCLDSKGLSDFSDIHEITMFADYRIPQILAFLGVLKYSQKLRARLKSEELFQSGERMEVELRGCTIHACELIVREVKKIWETTGDKSQTHVNAITVDNFFWCYRRAKAEEVENAVPFHRIRTIYY